MIFPLVSGAASMLTSIAGGIVQSRQIRIATERRLEQMRRQRDQAVGQATAAAGASGVEMTSSTIQNHLARLEDEWARRISATESDGAVAEGNTMMSSVAGGTGSFISSLAPVYDYQSRFGDPLASTQPKTKPDWKW